MTTGQGGGNRGIIIPYQELLGNYDGTNIADNPDYIIP